MKTKHEPTNTTTLDTKSLEMTTGGRHHGHHGGHYGRWGGWGGWGGWGAGPSIQVVSYRGW